MTRAGSWRTRLGTAVRLGRRRPDGGRRARGAQTDAHEHAATAGVEAAAAGPDQAAAGLAPATDARPTDPRTTDPRPTDPRPTDPRPTDPRPTDPRPTDPRPTDSRPTDPRPTDAGYLAEDAPAPGNARLQLSALQALCRQTFGVRMATLTIGTPFAMANATDGAPRYTVLAVAVLAITASHAMLRDWDRLGPQLLAHPTLMAVDLMFGAVLLITASPASPLAYSTVCTPLLSGLLYGWRGSGVFTGLQLVVLAMAFRAWEHRPGTGTSTLLIAGFCIAAGIIGVTLRNLMFRFGTASQALAEANSRLAVAEAIESERARLAREMHDSVTKTLHGMALAAEALAVSTDDADTRTLKHRAALVAASARRAAAESRDLLADLRRRTTPKAPTPTALSDLRSELATLVDDFASRTGIPTVLHRTGPAVVLLPYEAAHHVLAIAGEALENVHRHANAEAAWLGLDVAAGTLRLTVRDDGTGLPPGTTLDDLVGSGHFGLVGITERAEALGARVAVGTGSRDPGTEVRLELPLTSPTTSSFAQLPPREEAAHAG